MIIFRAGSKPKTKPKNFFFSVTIDQGYSTSFSKGPDSADEKSLGLGKFKKFGKGTEYLEKNFRLKTRSRKLKGLKKKSSVGKFTAFTDYLGKPLNEEDCEFLPKQECRPEFKFDSGLNSSIN